MVAVNNLYTSRIQLQNQLAVLKSGNINDSNIALFQNTDGLTQGMLDGSCTDGKDDGKIGFGESVKSLAKGAIKSLIPSSPMGWLKAIGTGIACAALVAVTGGAATPFLIAGGAIMGGVQAGKGIYQATQADTDAEKKQALENIGGGATTIATSVIAGKSYTKSTGNALVGKGSLSTYKSAASQSVYNVKKNFGSMTSSVKTTAQSFAQKQTELKAKFTDSVKAFDEKVQWTDTAKAYKEMISESSADEVAKVFGTEEMCSEYLKSYADTAKSMAKSVTPETIKNGLSKVASTSVAQAKSFIQSSKSSLNVKQMVSKLGEMGFDKSTAMEMISASNTKADLQQEAIQSSLSQYYM